MLLLHNRCNINGFLSLYAPCCFQCFKDQSSFTRSIFLLKPTVKVCSSLKYYNNMHSSLKVSWLFNCCDGGINIKPVNTKENDRYILDEMHASLVISYVTVMWYREKSNWIDRVFSLSVCLFSWEGGWRTRG